MTNRASQGVGEGQEEWEGGLLACQKVTLNPSQPAMLLCEGEAEAAVKHHPFPPYVSSGSVRAF